MGSFPHARPPEPETYAAAIGATLAQYPLGIVEECADPRVGLARHREFPPTVASVVEWCDGRLAYYKGVALCGGKTKSEREFSDEDRALAGKFLADLAAEMESRQHARGSVTLPTFMGAHIRKALERAREGGE